MTFRCSPSLLVLAFVTSVLGAVSVHAQTAVTACEQVVKGDAYVTGHTGTGIEAERIKLTGSTVTGNGLDLDADRVPKLKSSTCETSNGWGVCTND